ncbi:DUF952 domain-containing protein [Paracoccus subflavus]|uniref:DUF952 domain-containing protein n=1 Tax=Paracoccus subflavus TaxID=2528244 RepID=A0A4Q9G6Q1_9RHOB|nr:DUF952 domain-containing protein [Paracoccus subflavus]TBN43710.1 DUF952 domain-containing protein [Paracoccus subflavus]
MMIYKILRHPEWSQFQSDGQTHGAPVDRVDGFVHFSTALQLGETLRRHFSKEGDLVLLACRDADLGEALRWERSRGGDLFPHLYRALTMDDIAWSRDVARTPRGHETGPLE